MKKPTQKRLWKQIVRQKILAQADLLREHRGNDHGLKEMAKAVRSGDPANVEAQAARRYWPAIFDDPEILLAKIDGVSPPPDWMDASQSDATDIDADGDTTESARAALADHVQLLIGLLTVLLP